MKKNYYLSIFGLIMALFCVTFSSCKKDDDNQDDNQDDNKIENVNVLNGVWKTVSEKLYFFADGTIQDNQVDDNNYDILTFADKLTIHSYIWGKLSEVNSKVYEYTVTDNKLILPHIEMTFELSGDQLTLTYDVLILAEEENHKVVKILEKME